MTQADQKQRSHLWTHTYGCLYSDAQGMLTSGALSRVNVQVLKLVQKLPFLCKACDSSVAIERHACSGLSSKMDL